MPSEIGSREQMICSNYKIYSKVASISAGNEIDNCEVVVLGNNNSSKSSQYIKSFLMKDMMDIDEICEFKRKIVAQGHKIYQVFAKADPARFIRGRRTTMYSDADVNATRHARAGLGGVLAGVMQDTMIYVSGGAEHQGPAGGGVLAVVVDSK